MINPYSQQVVEFFTSYKEGFENRDIDNILAHYSFPLFIREDGSSNFFNIAEFRKVIEKGFGQYNDKGFTEAHFKILDVGNFDVELMEIYIEWDLLDHIGNIFSSPKCLYQITNRNDNPRIFGAIILEENAGIANDQ